MTVVQLTLLRTSPFDSLFIVFYCYVLHFSTLSTSSSFRCFSKEEEISGRIFQMNLPAYSYLASILPTFTSSIRDSKNFILLSYFRESIIYHFGNDSVSRRISYCCGHLGNTGNVVSGRLIEEKNIDKKANNIIELILKVQKLIRGKSLRLLFLFLHRFSQRQAR